MAFPVSLPDDGVIDIVVQELVRYLFRRHLMIAEALPLVNPEGNARMHRRRGCHRRDVLAQICKTAMAAPLHRKHC
jgi:hypothetical protein